MKITVTQEDIENGTRGSNASCPIALATVRQLGKPARVGSVLLHLYPDTGFHPPVNTFWLSRAAMRFVQRFDKRGAKSVKPFSFILKESK